MEYTYLPEGPFNDFIVIFFPPGMKESLFEYNPLKSLGYVFYVCSACKFAYILECKYSGTLLYGGGHQNNKNDN